jgi:hypothetical protein
MEPIKAVSIQTSATSGELTEDRIRQIVREEIAAHEERRHQEVTEFLAATEGLVRGTSESRL